MFYVKRYYFLPDIVEISYITMKHVVPKKLWYTIRALCATR
jgi:hypothetical protein